MSIYKSYGPYNQYEPYEDVIYRLTCCYASLRDNATYPTFNVFNNMESLHRTIEDAEQRMKSLAKDAKHQDYHWQSFMIHEIPIGVGYGFNRDGQRCRTYDRNGELVAESKASTIPDRNGNREIYWGREENECRFKVGDVVEVLCGGQVELHMIWQLPFNEAYARKKLPKEKIDRAMTFHLDDSDDCYITVCLTDEYPDHVDVMSCFPAGTLPLDESIVKKIKEVFDRCIARTSNQ